MTKLTIVNKNDKEVGTIKLEENHLINKITKLDNSILKIALNSSINIPHRCMGGSCGACICEIQEGKELIDINKIKQPVLKNIPENHILTCLCTIKKPLQENQTIKIKSNLIN